MTLFGKRYYGMMFAFNGGMLALSVTIWPNFLAAFFFALGVGMSIMGFLLCKDK